MEINGQDVLKIRKTTIVKDYRKDAKAGFAGKQYRIYAYGEQAFTVHTEDDFIKDFDAGNVKTVILDPPRAGIAPKSLLKVIDLGAKNIVYISCNPSTQARDMDTLISAGYAVDKISLVDQFPHTAHIETVVLFEK